MGRDIRKISIAGMEAALVNCIEPGDEVRWIYERNGKKKEVTLVAEAHPDRELFVVPEVTA